MLEESGGESSRMLEESGGESSRMLVENSPASLAPVDKPRGGGRPGHRKKPQRATFSGADTGEVQPGAQRPLTARREAGKGETSLLAGLD